MVLNGAGASFPAPVYAKWAYSYNQSAKTKINYQSVGSSAGVAQIRAKTVDFGASDEPVDGKELDASGLIQFPMLTGGVVPVVNLPGVQPGQMKLDQKALADIFLGKIKKWGDPAVKALNPDVNIPDLPVTVVHRSDGSGTTWIFTSYLSAVSDDWKNGPGSGKTVKWPAGVGAQKNPGVANNVQKVTGSIGYVEYTYAVEAKLSHVSLKNKDGNFAAPSLASFQSAAKNADWKNAPNFSVSLNNQPGGDAWPIVGATYILIYKDQADAAKAAELVSFFRWCLKDGRKDADNLNYVALPDNVVQLVEDTWKKSLVSGGQPVIK
jgi:phosphate transport system substrate-binding protein